MPARFLLHYVFSPWLIPVVLKPTEVDTGNDFIDSNNGLISGTVKDDDGSLLLENVKIELQKPDGTVIKTTFTDVNGFYVFSEVEPGGTYVIKETNLATYPLNVSDYDASDDGDAADQNTEVDDTIGVKLEPGEKDTDNNFVDSNNGAITGTVKDDNGNPIPGVSIQLQNSRAGVVATTTTDSNGAYKFTEVEPGTYKVVETNLPSFPLNVFDYDTTDDNDPEVGDKVTDNVVGVTLNPGETDSGNDFVDSDNGKITGTVTNDNGAPLITVLLTLKASDGDVVATTVTNGNGVYVFDNVEPGDYTVDCGGDQPRRIPRQRV